MSNCQCVLSDAERWLGKVKPAQKLERCRRRRQRAVNACSLWCLGAWRDQGRGGAREKGKSTNTDDDDDDDDGFVFGTRVGSLGLIWTGRRVGTEL
eukprot:269344-Rhodomonas_salina.1